MVFCVFVTVFCFCSQKKNVDGYAEGTTDDRQKEEIDSIHEVSVDSDLESSVVDDDVDTAELVWISIMEKFVSSELRSVFKNDTSNEDYVAVNAILQKYVKLVGKSFGAADPDCEDINFSIDYKDDNYISCVFGGTVFAGAHPSSFVWPVVVDIKNKKRLILKDIVKINDSFVSVTHKDI